MTDDKRPESTEEAPTKGRRAFVKGAANAAALAPAVVLLLSGATKAQAEPVPYGRTDI